MQLTLAFGGGVMFARFVMVMVATSAFSGIASAQSYEAYAPVSAARERAAFIHNRLTGQKLPIDSQVLKDMEALILQNNEMGAARLATEAPGFYTHTLRLMGNRLSNLPGSNRSPLTDLGATVMGFAKDDLDARGMLSSNFLYRFQNLTPLRVNVVTDIISSNNHYDDVNAQLSLNPNVDLRPNLVQARQQIATDANAAVNHPDPAGIITSRAFLSDCADAGTNRRCYEKVVKLLTCHTLEEVANSSLPDDRVGRDVSRSPGGDPNAFQQTCKACHSNMDGNRGAFAYTEFDAGRVKHGQVNGGGLFDGTTRVAVKMNRPGDANFNGGLVSNDQWVNYAVTADFANLYGWRDDGGRRITSPVISQGLNAYGRMVANSEAFSRCMVQTAFENVCRRAVTNQEKTTIVKSIAEAWEKPAQGNYKLRWLFERVATSPACSGVN